MTAPAVQFEDWGFTLKEASQRAKAALDKVGLVHKARLYPSKLTVASSSASPLLALAMERKRMIFNEATSSPDPELKQEVLSEMRRLAKTGSQVITEPGQPATREFLSSVLSTRLV